MDAMLHTTCFSRPLQIQPSFLNVLVEIWGGYGTSMNSQKTDRDHLLEGYETGGPSTLTSKITVEVVLT